jgi:hypothetical protein
MLQVSVNLKRLIPARSILSPSSDSETRLNDFETPPNTS